MNQKLEKYLPIGTIVLLKDATKRLMIIGFCSTSLDEDNKIYDYVGCKYPEGLLSKDDVELFDHDKIASIYYMGLIDKEEKEFKVNLTNTVNQINRLQMSTINSETNH